MDDRPWAGEVGNLMYAHYKGGDGETAKEFKIGIISQEYVRASKEGNKEGDSSPEGKD